MGMAIVLNTPAGILAPFMTNFLGIGAGTVATLFLVSKFYDVVTDPLMGVISDRTQTRWGRRRPFLLLGGIVGAAGLALAFNPPTFGNQTLLIAYMLGALLVTYTGYTVFNIPYLAMPAEMTTSYHERTNLMSHRTFFINIGGMISFSSFWLVEGLGNDRSAHGAMGWTFAIVIALGSAYCFLGTAPARQTTRQKHAYSIRKQIRTAFDNRPLKLLLGGQILSATRVGNHFLDGGLLQGRNTRTQLHADHLVSHSDYGHSYCLHSTLEPGLQEAWQALHIHGLHCVLRTRDVDLAAGNGG